MKGFQRENDRFRKVRKDVSPAHHQFFVSFSHTPLIIYRRQKQAMKCLTTTTLLLSAGAALGKEGRIEFGRSKPIATLKVDRQLGGKGGKSSKRDDKAGKYSSKSNKSSHSSSKSMKSSHASSKSMKSSHIQHISAPESTPVLSNSRDSRDIKLAEIDFGVEEVAEAGVEEVAEAAFTVQTQPLLNDGIAKDYIGATYIGIITTMALLWN
eukprot:scaffold63_cov120-Skeletonema_dohrnii-CCMP3373.AAC.3